MGSPRGRLRLALLLCVAAPLHPEGSAYPLVGSLSTEDLLYQQIQTDVQAYHYAEAHRAAGAVSPGLMIFRYRPGPAEDIAVVAARLNVTQATLATLNRVSTPGAFNGLQEVLITNLPGVFVPDAPASDLERALASARLGRSTPAVPVVVTILGARVSGRFFTGDTFTSRELVRFFRGLFRNPITGGRVSSRFGSRADPFDSGTEFHGGMDIVAPRGTPVVAAQSGTVTEVGSTPRYGTYVLVTHEHSYQSMYAHLDTVSVGLHDAVESGKILGTVGNTGLTTGAHLHFEIRWQGIAVDPVSYLPTSGSRE